MLLLFLGSWLVSGSLVYLPIWFMKHLTSWGLWLGAFSFLLFIGWCLGGDVDEL